MTTKAKRAKKVKPVKAWAVLNRQGYMPPQSIRSTRKWCIEAWCDPQAVDAPMGGWEWWKKQGARCRRVEIRVIGRNT